MNPQLQIILSKYQELDRLAASGEDVVADLRKEINNLELAYLKETVFPQIANTMGSMVNGLRCQIDGTLQLTEDNKIGYSFCTSRSMLMVQDSLSVEDCKESERVVMPTIENHTIASEPAVIPDLRFEDYSEKAIVVRGDTRQIADILSQNGGTLNFRLKGGPGWIFAKKNQNVIEQLLRPYFGITHKSDPDKVENMLDKKNNFNVKPLKPRQIIQSETLVVNENLLIKKILTMKCRDSDNQIIPYKPIIMLSIINAISIGLIKSNEIIPNDELESIFLEMWKKYVLNRSKYFPNMYKALIMLNEEDFFTLNRRKRDKDLNLNWSWDKTLFDYYVNSCCIDKSFYKTLKENHVNSILTSTLIEKIGNTSSKNKSTGIQKPNETKGKSINTTKEYFREYLINRKSQSLKTITQTNAKTYVMCLESQIVADITKSIVGHSDIFAVKALYLIKQIENAVLSKPGLTKLKDLHKAIQLYSEYMHINIQK